MSVSMTLLAPSIANILGTAAILMVSFGFASSLHKCYELDERGLKIRYLLWQRFIPFSSITVVSQPSVVKVSDGSPRLSIYTIHGESIAMRSENAQTLYETIRAEIHKQKKG